MNSVRAIALIIGLAILGAVAHVTILSTGGYGQPSAAMVIALACGVAIGAVAIGHVLTQRRYVLASGLVFALLAGEVFGLLRTADMYVASREAQQAPIRDAAARHVAAVARLGAAQRSDAVAKAEAAKAKIGSEAITASVAPSCRDNCRQVLEGRAADAQRAVEDSRRAVQAEIEAARTELARNPMPASASPLADRLGVPADMLDLVIAALGSIGCVGLAAGLIAFAAHVPRSVPRNQGPRLVEVLPPANLGPSLGDIDAFMLERVQATRGGRISWERLFTEYLAWCRASGAEAADVHAFGRRMNELAHELGRDAREDGGQVYFVGLGLKRLELVAS